METPSKLLERPPEEAAARIARGWLADAGAAAERLREPGDAEALHDFRVAIRRLRSTLHAWRRELADARPRRQRRRLARLQRRTGAGRDAEVALAWLAEQQASLSAEAAAGAAALGEALAARHRDAMAEARGELLKEWQALEPRLHRRFARVRVRVDLDRPPRRFGRALARKLRRAAQRLEERLGAVHELEDREAAHTARIAGKRLRYLLEPVGADAEACRSLCKQLQDGLGDLNDAHQLHGEIEALRPGAAPQAAPGLAELARRLERHRAALFAALRRDWLDGGVGRLIAETEALAARCEQAVAPPVEIERKYLLRCLPDLAALRARGLAVDTLEIEQGWLPGRSLRERLRRTRAAGGEERCWRTIKLGAGVERLEIEEETTREVFEALWALTEGCRIRKLRHRVRIGEWLWELDEFLDLELALAEVELPAAEIRPPLPDWLDVEREVTDEPGFTNLALAS